MKELNLSFQEKLNHLVKDEPMTLDEFLTIKGQKCPDDIYNTYKDNSLLFEEWENLFDNFLRRRHNLIQISL